MYICFCVWAQVCNIHLFVFPLILCSSETLQLAIVIFRLPRLGQVAARAEGTQASTHEALNGPTLKAQTPYGAK